MNIPKYVSPSAIRRSITTLVNAGYINPDSNCLLKDNADVLITMIVKAELIQKKKTIRKSKKK